MASSDEGPMLPAEVISHILGFLGRADRSCAARTCRQWLEASRTSALHADEVVFISHARAIRDLCPEATIHPDTFEVEPLPEPPPFQNFTFREVEVKTTGEMRHFWPRFGPKIRRLALQNCEVTEKAFFDLLRSCPNLRSLQVSGCNELFMSGNLLEGHDQLRLHFLTELELSNSRYLSDAIFNRFVLLAPNLSSVNLFGGNVTCSSAVHGRFYPHREAIDAEIAQGRIPLNVATNVLTFHNVLGTLSVRRVTSLSIAQTAFGKDNLKALCATLPGIVDLNLRHCYQLSKGIEFIADAYADCLQTLDISGCHFKTGSDLVHLGRLRQLRLLNLSGWTNLQDSDLLSLKDLTNLESLNISYIPNLSGPAICDALTAMKKLKHFYLNENSLMDSESLMKLLKDLPPLITLELSSSLLPSLDAAVSVVCNQHLSIQELNLGKCRFVSDVGLTGLAEVPDLNLQSNSVNPVGFEKGATTFHLGSKAEQEIVMEAKRKRDVAENMVPYKKMIQQCGQEFMGIGKLTNLKILNLSNCTRVSDLSIKNAFKFNQLKFLDLQNNCQLTDASMQHLAVFCPSLEDVDVSGCCRITNLGITYLSHLPRLRDLRFNGCDMVTDECLMALGRSKAPLKNVDFQRCPKLTESVISKFQNWLSQTNVWNEEWEKEEKCARTSIWYVPPPPPPLPNRGVSNC